MRAKAILAGAGGALAFAAVVGAGALAIVSIDPGERAVAQPDRALLMENPAASRLLSPAAPPSRPAAPPRSTLASLPSAVLREPPPASPTAPQQADAPSAGAPGDASSPPAGPQPQAGPQVGSQVGSPSSGSPRSGAEPPPLPMHVLRRTRRVAPADDASAAPGMGEAVPAPRVPPTSTLAARADPDLASAPRPAPPKVDPSKVEAAKPDPRLEGMMTPAEIRRMRAQMRLTPDQEVYWPPVEQALREVGDQQLAAVRAGGTARDALSTGTMMHVYFAARPLIGTLREDQKAQIRQRARAMGFASVASAI